MPNKKAALRMDGWSAGYGNSQVLRNLKLTAFSGEVVAILGENGAGKTTLFRSIMQLLPYQSGKIEILGRPIERTGDRRWARSQIGYVPQTHGQGRFPISVAEAVLLGRWGTSYAYFRRPSSADKDIADRMLQVVGLEAFKNKDCRSLSGGQKQRLNIARALVREPRILLLDEPTTYLDRDSQEMLASLIGELRQFETSVLIITHEHKYAQAVADRVLLLEAGVLAEKAEAGQ
ncbi:metal ABC transporter ATP-binding protein [Paenibacillus thalictri]|uniref:ATP-binding cassette domain-containing protein n=1 Tax=Paenibacillus thalictri TaxID=2527873 RepID=A0A4Q9DYD3_9BACL|nr:ATP-binding cassette domain-containing protein [Paenibacillus thalictri]TBL81110.1 ATP-binding cassette domain-containing protein [Paenibacillus thalictri]